MVDETEAVVLSSPSPGLWVGIRGAVSCVVEEWPSSYNIRVTGIASDSLLFSQICLKRDEVVNTALIPYGFRFTL